MMEDNRNTQLKIESLNCNILNTKLSEVKQTIIDDTPDVLCLCETWHTDKFIPKFHNYTADNEYTQYTVKFKLTEKRGENQSLTQR